MSLIKVITLSSYRISVFHVLFIHVYFNTFLGIFFKQLLDLRVVFTFGRFNASMNSCVEVFVQIQVFISLGQTAKTGIAGSHGNSVLNPLSDYQTVFHNSCTILHLYPQCMGFSFPHPCQHLLLSASLILAILVGVKWYLIIVLN